MEAVAIASHDFDLSKFCQRRSDQKDCNQANNELLKYEIRPDSEYPKMQYWLKHNGVGCLAMGELIGLSGKAKSGKGLFCLFLIVALLRGEYGGFKAQKKMIKALIIDNEQTGYSAQNNLRKVYSLCGWDSKVKNTQIDYYCLRDADIKTRRTVLENVIIECAPDVVFIDGIRDLLKDFNSIEESGELVNFLMRLTKQYNVTIINILHQNKADVNLRGHLGSEVVNKASEVYHVTKNVNAFKVVQTECRNAPIDDWSFELDEESRPVPAEIERTVSRADVAEMLFRNDIEQLFDFKDKYRYTELAETIQLHHPVKLRAAKDWIAKARTLGLIYADKLGVIRLNKEGTEVVRE